MSRVLLFSTSLSLGPTFHLDRVLVGFETQRHLVRDIADGAEGELFFCSFVRDRDTAHAYAVLVLLQRSVLYESVTNCTRTVAIYVQSTGVFLGGSLAVIEDRSDCADRPPVTAKLRSNGKIEVLACMHCQRGWKNICYLSTTT